MNIAKKIHQKENEKILLEARRYAATYALYYILALALLFISSFFMFRLFALGWWGNALYTLGMFLGLFLIWRSWYFYRANVLVVTNERVIDINRQSWFDEEISSISFLDILDVSVRKKGVLQNLFNFGTLNVQTKSQQFVLDIIMMKNPQRLQTFILEASHRFKHDRKLINNDAIYNNFIKIIPSLTDPQLKEVQRLIQDQFANGSASFQIKQVV